MSNLKGIGKGVGAGLGCLFYVIAGILGMAIHIWTIIIAYSFSGLMGAVITLCLPVIGQIYWFIRMWNYAGTFLNLYCLSIVGYVVFMALAIVFFGLSGISE